MASLVAALATVAVGGATPASAIHEYYCGVLVDSSYSWAPSPCYSSSQLWRYSSASYGGAGNIQYLRTGLTNANGDIVNTANYGTFTAVCWTADQSRRGRLAQYDGTARHTITGYADDSPNHTNC